MTPLSRTDFVKKYYSFVKQITQGTGIFIETLFAQAIIESQGKINGVYKVGGSKLAQYYNNLFGIKANSKWKGKKVNLQTREVYAGTDVMITDGFRVYDRPEDSMLDYVDFLKVNPRYAKAGVFSAIDFKDQAKKLQAAGYATDPNYGKLVGDVAETVRKIINDNNLDKFSPQQTPGTIINKTSIFLLLLLAGASYFIFKK